MTTPFKAMHKQDVAEAIGCSVRNIENLVSSGVLPKPKRLGGLVLWHPEEFYKWLDKVLRNADDNEIQAGVPESDIEQSPTITTARVSPSKARGSDPVKRMQARQAVRMNFA